MASRDELLAEIRERLLQAQAVMKKCHNEQHRDVLSWPVGVAVTSAPGRNVYYGLESIQTRALFLWAVSSRGVH